jgi:hypothetical protein
MRRVRAITEPRTCWLSWPPAGYTSAGRRRPRAQKAAGDLPGSSITVFSYGGGPNWTEPHPWVFIAALARRSCLIDGEVVICGEDGIPVFDRLRYGRQPQSEAVLFAFDLLELGGKDLRRMQLEERTGVLAKLVPKASWAVQLNEHIAERHTPPIPDSCRWEPGPLRAAGQRAMAACTNKIKSPAEAGQGPGTKSR